ncbi:MAG: hypothetical protein NZ455_15665 [Bacteroidia bacterium]|nr:hypothetical protein [Bacteroidia bacterium]MDW8302865.1 hypothetical protein [Bacteroidia bacterium]
MGVPLANARVGAFRTALRFGASLTLRTALTGMLHAPHANDYFCIKYIMDYNLTKPKHTRSEKSLYFLLLSIHLFSKDFVYLYF